MLRRFGAVLGAAAVAGAAFVGLTTGVAHADPACSDVHWMGAAGSGERDGAELTANSGMGRVMFQSYRDLQQLLQRDGRTITAEAVEYPAVPVPADGDLMGWAGFIGSVDTGTAALGAQYASFTQRCPATKVVLAGYSQGAMVVHRNLQALADSPNLASALLIADGDRLPNDTTINLGSVTAVPGAGKGVAQDWPILADAPTAPLPPALGARTVSVCDLGDAVCDYDPDAEETSSYAIAIHTSYGRAQTDDFEWTQPLYQLVGPAPVAPEADQVTPLGATAPTQ